MQIAGRARDGRSARATSSRSCTAGGWRSSIASRSGAWSRASPTTSTRSCELFASGALNAIGDLVKLVGIVVMMVSLDWHLSLIAFAALPLVALFVNWCAARSREAFRDDPRQDRAMNAYMNEQVSGMAVVQAFGREQAAADEFDEINGGYRDANIALDQIRGVARRRDRDGGRGLHGLDRGVARLSRRSASARWSRSSRTSSMFFEPISELAQRYTLLQTAMAGAERVFELLDIGRDRRAARPGRSRATAPRRRPRVRARPRRLRVQAGRAGAAAT